MLRRWNKGGQVVACRSQLLASGAFAMIAWLLGCTRLRLVLACVCVCIACLAHPARVVLPVPSAPVFCLTGCALVCCPAQSRARTAKSFSAALLAKTASGPLTKRPSRGSVPVARQVGGLERQQSCNAARLPTPAPIRSGMPPCAGWLCCGCEPVAMLTAQDAEVFRNNLHRCVWPFCRLLGLQHRHLLPYQ